jgi:threonine synthase
LLLRPPLVWRLLEWLPVFHFRDGCAIIPSMTEANALVCTACAQSYCLDTSNWRCACGGLFDLKDWPAFDVARRNPLERGLPRYRGLMPLDPAWEPVTLGEGNTPLLPVQWEGQPLIFKLESMAPTGSFKDRGAAALITALRGLGIKRVVEDSSGNAGASLAAYAARAGIACNIYVPSTAAGPKLAQITSYGANVVRVEGRREAVAEAAWAATTDGAYYASHVYNPYFLAGAETFAYEIWEQLGRQAPSAVVMPVGNGSLLLGIYRGFLRLDQAGLVARMPRIFGVQAAACDPIYRAFSEGRLDVAPVISAPTMATGIAVSDPARGAQILAAVRNTEGAVVIVSEEETAQARNELARRGFYVEHTSAVAVAALPKLRDRLGPPGVEPAVVPLTGHGLKVDRQW